MTDEQIEKRLQLHILNLCLAGAAGKEGDIKQAKGALVREVARIALDAVGEYRMGIAVVQDRSVKMAEV